MTESDDAPAPKTAHEKLAELVARRKTVAGHRPGVPGQRQSEQAAAARSNAKSKPAMRK